MAGRTRVELNRAALDQLNLALADGVFELLAQCLIRASASAPDAPPYGQGLPYQGGVLVYVDRKKVHETTAGGDPPVKKPRGSTASKVGLVNGLIGFGFPALFNELGTVHQPARPFVVPAVLGTVGSEAEVTISKAFAKWLGSKGSRAV